LPHERPAVAPTISRATLFFVSAKQNIALTLARGLLKRIQRLAARRRALAAIRAAGSLGTRGRRTWSRDDLHAR
jgi:hypothetical protein